MTDENEYESARQLNIEQNRALIKELGLTPVQPTMKHTLATRELTGKRKRRLVEPTSEPQRVSARLAAIQKPSRERNMSSPSTSDAGSQRTKRPKRKSVAQDEALEPSTAGSLESSNVDAIVKGWTSWHRAAEAPSRDEEGDFHFDSLPEFTPNKSPAEIIREGAFGGSFFRPLRSKRLGVTVSGDWRELPEGWLAGLDLDRYVYNTEYDPTANKYRVACGQSIEQWEANGWIVHEHDVRGWFQWYCRFFRGRRCGDDARQVGRWARCVGPKGRWRRVLLKQYVQRGVRSVMDEEGGEGGPGGEVSAVVSQTCFHWAWEVRQSDLDAAWQEFR